MRARSFRRRPVPREWREDNHSLDVRSRYHGGGAIAGSRVYRARGYCSCGAQWPSSPTANNYAREDVIEAWKDHVEDAYYAEEDARAGHVD